MKLTIFKTLPVLAFLLIISSCEKEFETIEQLDERNIQAFIKENSVDVQKYNNTGIYYKVLSPGAGAPLTDNQEVAVVFTVTSLDGKYSAADTLLRNRYADFLGYLAPEGFKIAAKEILKNSRGKIRLILPSRLGYGRNGNSVFPGNTSLDVYMHVILKSELPQYDDASIKSFLKANNLTDFTKSPRGLYYKISNVGTGPAITTSSRITVEYTGKLLDGRTFDANKGILFYLDDLVQAWHEAMPLIKEGGSIRFITPSSLGYGFKATPNLPAFSCLDFDVKVTKVE